MATDGHNRAPRDASARAPRSAGGAPRSAGGASARAPRSPRGAPRTPDVVAEILRGRIRAGVAAGGTRLVQARLADELGVSTASIRTALRQLESEGLVRADPRLGPVVHELSRTELVELYEIRKLLEPVATARAAKCASAESILEAVELVAVMGTEDAAPRWAEYNLRFHSVIEEAGSSPRLAVILRNLRELSALYVTHSILSEPERVSQANAEHEEILRAIVDRDPEAAADAVLRHLDGTLTTLLTVRQVSGPAGKRR